MAAYASCLLLSPKTWAGKDYWTVCRDLAFERSNACTFEPRLHGRRYQSCGPGQGLDVQLVWRIVGPYVPSNLTGGR
jgi:hypothetical protein